MNIRAFERAQIDFQGLFPQETLTYESNIEYTLRFMIDTKVGGDNEKQLMLIPRLSA